MNSESAGPRQARRRPIAEPPGHARQHAVAMPDGVRLATDVYLPSAGRGPVLLSRLPYDKAGEECFMPALADRLTERGYVVVVQDVRGKLRSGGETRPFVAEVADGYHTIDWIVRQPWCAGPVGMFGDSYYGYTQWAAAASGHPALRALSPRVTTADLAGALSTGGVLQLELSALWSLQTWVDPYLYEYEDVLDWTRRPLAEIVPAALGGRRTIGLDDWAMGLGVPALPVRGDLPTLHLGGFADVLLPSQLRTWQAARRGPARDWLALDSRDHVWTPRRAPGEPYADPLSSPKVASAFLDDYLAPLIGFFDRELRGLGDDAPAPVRWRVGDDWREAETWPPADARPRTLRLTKAGALRAAADRGPGGPVSWTHDATDPVPSIDHVYDPLVAPVDARDQVARDDLLAFSGEQVAAPVDLAGPAVMTAWLSAATASAHLMVAVYDAAPDGSVWRIADAAALVRGPWPAMARVDLGSLGHRLEPGHRLVVTLSGSLFPRYALHPGVDEDLWHTSAHRARELTVLLGGPRGAVLEVHAIGNIDGGALT